MHGKPPIKRSLLTETERKFKVESLKTEKEGQANNL